MKSLDETLLYCFFLRNKYEDTNLNLSITLIESSISVPDTKDETFVVKLPLPNKKYVFLSLFLFFVRL